MSSGAHEFDAVVVGSGPNGLAAAIAMQQAGLSVLLLEEKETIGGGLRTAEVTLPGFRHDICSAVHPMTLASPFFASLPLSAHGLRFIQPQYPAAHPFDDGTAAILYRSLSETAAALGADEKAYLQLMKDMVGDWHQLLNPLLGPLKFPAHPLTLAKFGLKGLQSAEMIARRFSTRNARGLWAGMAAHAIQPLSNLSTAAFGMVLAAVGHIHGWPIPEGGAGSIASALASLFISMGGKIQTGFPVASLEQLPAAPIIMMDVGPRQLCAIAGNQLSALYRWQLGNFRYGMGVFKIDWALSEPVPFTARAVQLAGTVHLGNTLEEISLSERQSAQGIIPQQPYTLFTQPSIFDSSRAPAGKHTAWAYCHVPQGSTHNMTTIIERQVERFAPGFRDIIIGRHTMNTQEMEYYNPNYVGGDINGGLQNLGQLYSRPALRLSPYRTSKKGLYICSSSTPPGGGVHGMCGYHAAKQAMADIFNLPINTKNLNNDC